MASNSPPNQHPNTNRLSYAIPMPYIPSNTSTTDKQPSNTPSTHIPASVPEEGAKEINVDLLTERRSSLELAHCAPSLVTSPSHTLLSRAVQSTAVVKYSSLSDPTPLAKLAEQTNLNLPPSNWLRDNPSTKGFVPSPQLHSGFTSFRMANDFVDCLADVDVVSDGENIKKLLKIPYSKNPISMVVHRVGKTLLLDDFDIHRYLLRRSASQWEWIRKFFTETVLQQIDKKELEGAVVRKNASSSALQERNLVSKFLYRTLQNSLENELKSEEEKSEISSLSLENLPPLPEPQPDELPNFNAEKFARNLLWTFEDIRMLIGSNMPIFGDAEHPCVSLRLRDMKKPINILTGMDYWLDNLMCQVPEVVMCYHLDGIVQKYELVKTEDLPSIDGSKFSPKIVKNIAQNILSFLKSNAAKEGHTYWLFKAKDDDIVKLYDLTSLSQQDSGIKPGKGDIGATDSDDVKATSGENPFQTPVSMLLYRLARNILESGDRGEEEGTVRELLTNCVELLDSEKFPHIATSAHFLLSELYLPDGTDPAMPAFSGEGSEQNNAETNHEQEQVEGEDGEEDVDYSQYSVEVQTLCLPGSLSFLGEKRSPPISATVENRCISALKHIDQGLKFLSSLETKREKREAEMEKERERVERENLNMSVPNKPIPMGYMGNCPSSLVHRPRSVSEGPVRELVVEQKELTWTEYLKFLLLKKALLVYITMAEVYFTKKYLGRTLKCVKRSMNCYSMVVSLGGEEEARPCHDVVSFALGVAGDCYMACVANWDSMPVYQEQYNTSLPAGSGIAKEVEKYTTELDRDWTIKQPRDIREAMELAIKCYTRALEISGSQDASLVRRLANVENELGVFYMNQATALVQKINDNQELAVTAMAGAQDLFNFSRKYLNQGITKFESISDVSNTALLLSNSGRLSRLAGHAAGLQAGQDGEPAEFCGEEASHYKIAIEFYHKALAVLGSKKTSSQIWDTVSWELSSTLFTVGTLLQDHAPLSTQTRDEVEKSVTEHMSQALKYCDIETPSPRQVMYQTRAAVIHHRLASLYHHSYRCYATDDNSSRKKNLKQLSELHYVKASQLFLQVDRNADYLRTVLERAGLAEAQLPAVKGESAKHKLLLQVLDIVLETNVVVAKLVEKEGGEVNDKDEWDEERKMLETVVQRIQFILLSMVKLGTIIYKNKKKGDKKGGGSVIKDNYAAALKCSGKSSNLAWDVHQLLTKVAGDRNCM